MKRVNDQKIQAKAPVRSGNKNANGNEIQISNLNDRKQELPVKAKKDQVNEEDDLMNRSDFQFFYSGRKLL